MPSPLSVLHFNDVYRVSPQKTPSGTIDVAQFAALVDDLRSHWPNDQDGKPDGLFLFSGDVFSPSVESSVTRGSHMVPVLNELGIDVSLTGNHDFDFGYLHLCKLLRDTNFPWLLSNIIDKTTSRIPNHLKQYIVLERAGIRIGIIGLVEKEWIATVASWPPEFIYKSMKDTGIELSKTLRDPAGEHKCDIIIALTHARLPNDINLARELLALSPSAQKANPIVSDHGIDLLLGGHDHLYYAGPGVTSWDGFDVTGEVLGAELDCGDVLVVKSGSDFRDISSIDLVLEATPEGSVRRKVITEIRGKRNVVQPGSKPSPSMAKVVERLLSDVSSTFKAPVCKSTTLIDVRSYHIRVQESPVANWLADIARHTYDDALCMKGCGGSDGALLCAGTFRGDSTYGPGVITLGDILEILPFEDPIVVLEVDGATLWDALESALSTWPAQEGRFPSISGFRVRWDSRRGGGNRVLGVSLLKTKNGNNHEKGSLFEEEEPVVREAGGKTYKLVTREYMAQGHDGFTALTRGKWLIDHESGSIMSSIVRKYLLGAQFVNRLIRLRHYSGFNHLLEATKVAAREEEREIRESNVAQTASAVQHWKHATTSILLRARSTLHYQNHLAISAKEHMSDVDVYDGSHARKGIHCDLVSTVDDLDLLVVSPKLDGRLKDDGSQS